MRFERILLLFPDYKGGHFGALRPPDMDRIQRKQALKTVRDVRKKIRFNSMKAALSHKLGGFAGLVAKVYVNDWFQDRLMKNRVLRRNLKRAFMHFTH